MAKQDTNIILSDTQKNILNLEKKYMKKIEEMLHTNDFKEDLTRMEKSLKSSYSFLSDVWNLKNKVKIPAERLLRYHFYSKFEHIVGFYPSPISCDIAVETNDAILNIDIKTIDINGNKGDIHTIQFEHNQTSFKHKNVQASKSFKGFKVQSNLPTFDIETKKPILTYLLKIIYNDDGEDFYLSKGDEYPTMILTCLPNGELSDLFQNDLITNFKTYTYYSESDEEYFKEKFISITSDFNIIPNHKKHSYIEKKINIPFNWEKIFLSSRVGYYDLTTKQVWATVDIKNNKTVLRAVKSPNTGRFNVDFLTLRFDSEKKEWQGNKPFNDII